ncbi:MAG: flagellar biosynthesis protein FlgL [Pseudomonadota bacterium]
MTTVSTSTGAYYQRSLSQMNGLRDALERLQNQIATGQRIERGSEDPAAASRLRALTRVETLADIQEENAAKLAQDLTFAADEVGGVADLLIRARELAIRGGNDTLDEVARAAVAEELEQLGEELFDRANSLTLTREPLFAGTAAGPAYIRDAAGVVVYNGNNENGAVPVASGTEIERGVTGPEVFEFELNGAPTTTFAVLADLVDAFRGNAGNPATASVAAIDGLDAALDAASRNQAVLGTRLAWVEVIEQNQADRAIATAEQRSEVGDTELADALARLQQTLTALEASQASFARVSTLTLFNAI